jgi:hypothetical protein
MLAIGLAAAMALTASAARAQAPDSQQFIKAVIEGNLAAIDNGKLA